jgi:methylamine---glutamate N-methyltransferase subunit B
MAAGREGDVMATRETIVARGIEIEVPEGAAHLDADGLDAFEFNRRLRALTESHDSIVVHHPRARHNLAVGLTRPAHVMFLGSVGYYCGGFNNGALIEVYGNGGWGLGEAMAAGRIVVRGNTAWAAGASMRGGIIVVHGHGGPRTGVAQKGGTILVGGSLGFMSGFMAHRGKLVALSGAGDALGASLYEGRIFVAGPVKSLGGDAVYADPTPGELAEIRHEIEENGLGWPGQRLRKVVAEGRLWYFDARDAALWRTV